MSEVVGKPKPRWRVRRLQIFRRSVQMAVVLLMLAIPVVARYTNYLSAHHLEKAIDRWEGTIPGESLALTDYVLRALPKGEKERAGKLARNRKQVLIYAQAVRGGAWSVKLGGMSLTDPLAGLESIAASKTLVPVLLISLIIPVLVTLILGRVFCSWICPVGFMLEMTDKLRIVFRFLELPLRDVRFTRVSKYILLVVGLLLAAVLAQPVLGYIYPPAIISREAHDLVFTLFDRAEMGQFGFSIRGLTWMSLLLLAIVLFEVMVSRRWWCRYLCPGGGLYSLLGAFRAVRIVRNPVTCTDCGDCVKVCPMGLVPMRDQTGVECDNCGLCVSHCDDDALHLKIKMKSTLVMPTATPRLGNSQPAVAAGKD